MQFEEIKQIGFKNHYEGIKHEPNYLGSLSPNALSAYLEGVIAASQMQYTAFITKTKTRA